MPGPPRHPPPPDDCEAAPATDICRSCGLCCNAGIFPYLDLTAADRDRLAGGGVPAPERIAQPCGFWQGQCTVYAVRPAACRRFECDTLGALTRGEIDRQEASRRIDTAIALRAKLAEKLPGEAAQRDLLNRWIDAAPGERAAEAGNAFAELLAYQLYIDRHFHRAARGESLSPR
ncbi:YkgJ family cysteine cluster protein [Tsuneonella sp. YG55]|uniref:YkgJ family cysteine cluster protein n=1 Tax=Tsuneonella litorea TaxID=2976475 RepID=A0A9X2W1T8_9SPHN|nr:YkgJ family cysteine cluster protein [Tsuneonella litorea]MCT2558729.1 YkgJ family cysteine cluster protein [Tsuneonella litorea]